MSTAGANFFKATLASSLAAGGSETTIYLSTIETLNGETITTADFATFGRGTLTIDPLNSNNLEVDTFTAVDSTNIAVTGVIRGLSAKSNTAATSRAKYHPVGTTVIIAFGVHNLLDLLDYVATVVSGAIGTASNTTSGSTRITEDLGSRPRSPASLVSQQTSPNMTLKINPFAIAILDKNVRYTGGNTGTIVAPVTNPRIDLVVYSTSSSTIVVRGGTETASPAEPSPQGGDIVLCSVYNRVGETSIKENDDTTNGYIKRWYIPGLYGGTSIGLTADETIAANSPVGFFTNQTLKCIDLESSSSQSLSVANNFNFTAGSIDFWMKPESITAGDIMADTSVNAGLQGFQLAFNATPKITFGFGATTKITGSTTIGTGTWIHVAVTWSTAGSTLYVNGVSDGTGTAATLTAGGATFYMGRQAASAAGYFDGKIINFRIWDKTLTVDEVNAYRIQEVPFTVTNLQANWRLNDALTDASGNAYTLTNNGTAVFATDAPTTLAVAASVSGRVFKASASNSTSARTLGFTLASAVQGDTVTIVVTGSMGGFTGLVPGTQYYLSNTAGSYAATAGTVSQKVGLAISTTEMVIMNNT